MPVGRTVHHFNHLICREWQPILMFLLKKGSTSTFMGRLENLTLWVTEIERRWYVGQGMEGCSKNFLPWVSQLRQGGHHWQLSTGLYLAQGSLEAALLGDGQGAHSLPACTQLLHLDPDPGGVILVALYELPGRALQCLHTAGPLPQLLLEDLGANLLKRTFNCQAQTVTHTIWNRHVHLTSCTALQHLRFNDSGFLQNFRK